MGSAYLKYARLRHWCFGKEGLSILCILFRVSLCKERGLSSKPLVKSGKNKIFQIANFISKIAY